MRRSLQPTHQHTHTIKNTKNITTQNKHTNQRFIRHSMSTVQAMESINSNNQYSDRLQTKTSIRSSLVFSHQSNYGDCHCVQQFNNKCYSEPFQVSFVQRRDALKQINLNLNVNKLNDFLPLKNICLHSIPNQQKLNLKMNNVQIKKVKNIKEIQLNKQVKEVSLNNKSHQLIKLNKPRKSSISFASSKQNSKQISAIKQFQPKQAKKFVQIPMKYSLIEQKYGSSQISYKIDRSSFKKYKGQETQINSCQQQTNALIHNSIKNSKILVTLSKNNSCTSEMFESNLFKDKCFSDVGAKLQDQSNQSKYSTNFSGDRNYSKEQIGVPKILIKLSKKGRVKTVQNQGVCCEQNLQKDKCDNFNSLLSYCSKQFLGQRQRLLKSLSNQIKLDQSFRNAKKWFQRAKIQNKWLLLQFILKKEQLWVNQLAMKAIFLLQIDQENPLYTPREDQFDIGLLVNTFKLTEEHWREYVEHKFNIKQLQNQHFSQDEVDISNRGYISIEDLVRYLNCEVGTFYRNRDLFLIYLRFKNQEKLLFQDILHKLTVYSN